MKLYEHQKQALKETAGMNHVAYYHDMGLGKTYTGAEKMMRLGAKVNLIVCQKSKIDDWCEHFLNNYIIGVYRLTDKNGVETFISSLNRMQYGKRVGIINYDLIFRRPELLKLTDFTLLLDESSLIQNETAKRSKFILKMKPKNVILLSGTPTGGKYENLWSQMHLLGWDIPKKLYWKQYIETEYLETVGRSIPIVTGYKNVDRLKKKMRQYGCNFLKTEEVLDLPEQIEQTIRVPTTKEYRTFRKDSIVNVHTHVFDHLIDHEWDGKTYDDLHELVGDTTLTKMVYERQLCGQYNRDKLKAFSDLVESTSDRLIVFYNFTAELDLLMTEAMMLGRPISVVNGYRKTLDEYEQYNDSITFIQYQAGAMGLNLQKANKIIYFTPPLSSELFEQSKKRIHRINQTRPCFYYYLTCTGSVEEKIYKTLAMRKDFTEKLFEEEL